jgi:selenocysteine lyase/cysteine desulfurase
MTYLDNAATSFPKAPGVGDALAYFVNEVGGNAGRGSYDGALEAGRALLKLRRAAAQLFGFSDPSSHVVITPGQTFALNQCIKGYVHRNDHVVTGALEHNSVMRPLSQVGARVTRLPVNHHGLLAYAPDAPAATATEAAALVEAALRPDTRLMVVSQASNVCGSLMPLEVIARVCRAHQVPLVVDAAQSAGHLPLDCTALGISALCVPGHKGLRGPQGIGLMLLAPRFATALEPLVTGGTGSASDSEEQPTFLPDKFESGTLNLPAVFGLHVALDRLSTTGLQAHRRHENALGQQFIEGLAALEGQDPQELTRPLPGCSSDADTSAPTRRFRLVGTTDLDARVGVFSLDFAHHDNAEVAFRLEQEHHVLTRCGLHCAPHAHKVLDTFPQGTVRFSFSPATTSADIEDALSAIAAIID